MTSEDCITLIPLPFGFWFNGRTCRRSQSSRRDKLNSYFFSPLLSHCGCGSSCLLHGQLLLGRLRVGLHLPRIQVVQFSLLWSRACHSFPLFYLLGVSYPLSVPVTLTTLLQVVLSLKSPQLVDFE